MEHPAAGSPADATFKIGDAASYDSVVDDFDMKITALTDAAVSFTPLDFVDSGFTTDIEGDVGIVDSFFDVFFDLTDSYSVAGNSNATFDYGTLKILNNAPGGSQIIVIAKAVPDPMGKDATGADLPHDPFELESKVPVNIPGDGVVPLPGTALLLSLGLAGTLAWRRARRG